MSLRGRFTAVGSILALLLSAMVALAQPAAAAGPTVTMTGTAITYVGTEGNDIVRIDTYSLGCTEGQLCIRIHSEPPITAATGCVLTDSGIARCGPATPATVDLLLGAGDDQYTTRTDYMTPSNFIRISPNGGPGNDILRGASPAEIMWGGPGNDVIYPDVGTTSEHVGHDIISGGDGFDTVVYSTNPGAAAGTKVTLDGVPNDGTTIAGDVDNIYDDVDSVRFGSGNDSFLGSAKPETVDGGGGNDTLDGAGGADTIYGGSGDDTLIGGPGVDQVFGDNPADSTASGNDVLQLRDGEPDRADCGPGSDSAEAESADVVDNCEMVSVGTPPAQTATMTISGRRLNANKSRKRARILVTCTGGLPCTGRITLRATGKSRKIVGRKSLGKATYSITANSRVRTRVRLNRHARTVLKRTKRAAVRLRFTANTGERGERRVRLTR